MHYTSSPVKPMLIYFVQGESRQFPLPMKNFPSLCCLFKAKVDLERFGSSCLNLKTNRRAYFYQKFIFSTKGVPIIIVSVNIYGVFAGKRKERYYVESYSYWQGGHKEVWFEIAGQQQRQESVPGHFFLDIDINICLHLSPTIIIYSS